MRAPAATIVIHVRHGFTLIEVTVVVVILAILASMMVPHFSGTEHRQFQLAVDQTEDMLTMYSQRESLGQKVVGLHYDPVRNELSLMEIDTDYSQPGAVSDWRMDQNVKPVQYPAFMRPEDIQITADGQWVDTSSWPLSTTVGQDRPTIEITLSAGADSERLLLMPYAVAPLRMNDLGDSAGVRERIDLDNTGRSRENW
jgi:prepilin-type N-terminal cleavage/methylation domain-containing protein